MTDQQRAYNRALRELATARAYSEAATPPTEEQTAAIVQKRGEDGLAAVEAHQRRRLDAAEDARYALEEARASVEVQLGRPLTRHEAEAGFGMYGEGPSSCWPLPEHRWWDTDPRRPCEECAGGQRVRPLGGAAAVARPVPADLDVDAERRRQIEALKGGAA